MSQARNQGPAYTHQWSPRSNLNIFVRALHLLNLDLDSTWPGITEPALNSSNRNLQQRVKCVEWALYKLFEVYNTEETKNKLRPFFPPLAQLQSLNLRAALLRCLTDLKKNGVLPKEIQLRKTMLDECHGERFEELLATFSMIVLRKVSATDNVEVGRSTKESKQQPENLIPLIIAYRNALRGDIKVRQGIDEKAVTYQQLLEERTQELSAREAEIRMSPTLDLGQLPEELEMALQKNWVGNKQWIDEIMRGTPGPVTRAHFPDPPSFDSSTTLDSKAACPRKPALLDELQTRIDEHNQRLEKWRAFIRTLPTEEPKPAQPSTQVKKISTRSFTDHQSIKLDSDMVLGDSHMLEDYAALLDNMRSEMGGLSTMRAASGLIKVERTSTPPPLLGIDNDSEPMVIEAKRPMSELQDEATVQGVTLAVQALKMNQNPLVSQASQEDTTQDKALLPGFSPMPSVSKSSRLSLAERARLTLASSRRPRLGDGQQDSMSEETTLLSSSPPKDNDSSPLSRNRSDNLAISHDVSLGDRTRQSLALLSNKLQRTKSLKSSSPKRRPKATRAATDSPEKTLETITSSLNELAIDEDAEYASVFKSRPKLRHSPPSSPARETSNDVMMKQNAEHGEEME